MARFVFGILGFLSTAFLSAGRSVELVLPGCWGSWRRHSAFREPSLQDLHGCCCSSTARRAASHFDASEPTRDVVQGRQEVQSSFEWGHGRQLGGLRSLDNRGSKGGSIDFHGYLNPQREEGEVRPDHRPERRRRISMRLRSNEGSLVCNLHQPGGRHAIRGRGPIAGAVEWPVKAASDGNGTLHRLFCVGSLPAKGGKEHQVPDIHLAGQRHVLGEDGSGPCIFQSMAGLFPGHEDSLHHVEDRVFEQFDEMGSYDGETSSEISAMLASLGGGRKQSSVRSSSEDTDLDEDENRQRREPTTGVGPKGPVGDSLDEGHGRLGVLADSNSCASTLMAGERRQRIPADTGGGSGSIQLEGGNFFSERWRRSTTRLFTPEDVKQSEERGKEEEACRGARRASSASWERKWKTWRSRQRRKGIRWGRRMFCLEQWQWGLCRISRRRAMQRKEKPASPVHDLQESGTPEQGLSTKEGWLDFLKLFVLGTKATAGSEDGPPPSSDHQSSSSSASTPSRNFSFGKGTKINKFLDENDKKVDGDEVEIGGVMRSEKGYFEVRTFTFVHHFAGVNDRLGEALKEEAQKQGIKIRVVSVEKEKGANLLESEPFNNHKEKACSGDIDGYHSGFPCDTFTRLRWRRAPGLPPPLRSRDFPYGLPGLSDDQQRQADAGTIMMCRSLEMGRAMEKGHGGQRIPGFYTFENPPSCEVPQHISAWEMPEMKKFVEEAKGFVLVFFHTCRYLMDKPQEERYKKPQCFGGTLPGLLSLGGFCQCGEGASHDFIVGKEKSRASGAYPKALCASYARLAISHFVKMGKAEFLEAKHVLLEKNIDKLKVIAETRHKEMMKCRPTTPPRSTVAGSPWAPRKRKRDEVDGEEEGADNSAAAWSGGRGRYGLVREGGARKDGPKNLAFVGGMRNPLKSVEGLPTVEALGMRINGAWNSFLKKHPGAVLLAETYGTKDPQIDEEILNKWKEELSRIVGARPKPKVELREAELYRSPVDVNLLQAWSRRSGDPETEVGSWLENGAPLGIEQEIKTCNIFPPSEEDATSRLLSEAESEASLSKHGFRNYLSVEENMDDAKIELGRYEKEGYVTEVPLEMGLEKYKGGTLSKLGLVIKVKEGGERKRRLVIDLRRSGGNGKSHLPERLVLPRPGDAVQMVREQKAKIKHRAVHQGRDGAEFALVDIADAFTTLPIHRDEHRHSLAPGLDGTGLLCFKALLFGFKTAPLLYSRFGAMLARLVQSIVDPTIASHQVYLDDSLWLLTGTLEERNQSLSLILYTLLALKVRIALGKGERAAHVQWVGIRFSLVDSDTLVLNLPEKFLKELREGLISWESKGMVATKELRTMAGKAAWLGSILPRSKWCVAVLYSVLKAVENDELTGKETERAQQREKDNRPKKGLFAVKRLETARQWLVAFLQSALDRPARKLHVGSKKTLEVKVMCDASPEGLGAVLILDGMISACLASEVSEEDARALQFNKGESSSQGIVESLAVLVAIKHWSSKLRGYHTQLLVQGDSLVALALTQRLAASSASLNFLGAELSLALEMSGVERIEPLHIPGVLNTAPDYLSRPSKWSASPLPQELQGLKVETPQDRSAGFYSLPCPGAEPGLWGAEDVATVGSAAWEHITS